MTTGKNPSAVKLGRLGGKARAKKLTKEELSEQGRKAVQARWAKARAAEKTASHRRRLKGGAE
jgi:hypothetical protein